MTVLGTVIHNAATNALSLATKLEEASPGAGVGILQALLAWLAGLAQNIPALLTELAPMITLVLSLLTGLGVVIPAPLLAILEALGIVPTPAPVPPAQKT